jgi:hypothetical protein
VRWLEESDNEGNEPLWLLASFLPFIWAFDFSVEWVLFDHQCSFFWEQKICEVNVRVMSQCKFDFPFSSYHMCLSNWRTSGLHVWLSVWYSSKALSFFHKHKEWLLCT